MKKVLIEIPDEFENDLKDKFNDFFGRVRADLRDYPSHDKLCGNYEMETIDMFLESFDSSKVLSEMTNGEVIKAMFPYINDKSNRVQDNGNRIVIYIDMGFGWRTIEFEKDWWNAPYKKEVEE